MGGFGALGLEFDDDYEVVEVEGVEEIEEVEEEEDNDGATEAARATARRIARSCP